MQTLEIGRVSRPHGLAGELRVALHWAESSALQHVRRVWLRTPDGAARRYEVRSSRGANKAVLLAVEGVGDRDSAEALRGAAVLVERSELPPLEVGEYYLSDLLGAAVVAPGGEIGRVVEVRTHPSVDSIVIDSGDGRLREQPLAAVWLEEVDVAKGRIVLTSEDGLID